jgi:uncharacterized protein (TIGR03643 family)
VGRTDTGILKAAKRITNASWFCLIIVITEDDINRIIEMAWEDRTPFEAIEFQFGLREPDVIALMRSRLKPSSFSLWRSRVSGRNTKHRSKRSEEINRFKCSRQRSITRNKISKR